MDNHITCPHCKHTIPLSEALSHELEEKISEKYRTALRDDRKRFETEFQKKLEEEKNTLLTSTRKKIEEEMALKLTDSKNEADELKKQNKDLSEQFLELNKMIRQLKVENEQKQMEMEKKMLASEEKLREEERKKLDEVHRMKFLEYEKKLTDAIKVNEDLKRKLEQGSQQTQGEVLELEIENILKAEFPMDTIVPVAKGITGADLLHTVRNSSGKGCGSIVWEAKRTKAWSNGWLPKLRDDQRAARAEFAVLITEVLPTDVKHAKFIDGVWVTSYQYYTALAVALRQHILGVAMVRSSQEGKSEKMEVLYNYIYGTEFRQRIESIVEAFSSLQDDIEKEKRYFAAKWAKQEKSIRKVLDNTIGMSGELESITGQTVTKGSSNTFLEDGNDRKISEQESLL